MSLHMTNTGQNYEDLEVFRRSHQCAMDIYRLTRTFPGEERFRLADQLRRAAVSVPCNIAEGYGRFYRGDLLRFLYIARGSAEETRYLLLLAQGIGYLDAESCQKKREEYTEIIRMLNGLIAHHRRKALIPKP